MPHITYHHTGGNTDVVDAEPGTSLMRAALKSGVKGIVGECGGQAMCATCHVYVREGYLDSLPVKSEDEEEMLEVTTAPLDEARSRLGCQLTVGDGLAAIEVDVPESQV